LRFFCFLAVVSNPFKVVKATLSPRDHRNMQQSPSLLMRSVHNCTSPCSPRLLFPDVPTRGPVVFPVAPYHAPLLLPAVPTRLLALFPLAPFHAPGQTVLKQPHVVTTNIDVQKRQSDCAMSTVESQELTVINHLQQLSRTRQPTKPTVKKASIKTKHQSAKNASPSSKTAVASPPVLHAVYRTNGPVIQQASSRQQASAAVSSDGGQKSSEKNFVNSMESRPNKRRPYSQNCGDQENPEFKHHHSLQIAEKEELSEEEQIVFDDVVDV
jgi:hypothetical protein